MAKGCRAGKGALALPICAFLPWVPGSPGLGPVSWRTSDMPRDVSWRPSLPPSPTRGRLCRRQGWASVRGGCRGARVSPAAQGWAPPRRPSKSSNGLHAGWDACVRLGGVRAGLRGTSESPIGHVWAVGPRGRILNSHSPLKPHRLRPTARRGRRVP